MSYGSELSNRGPTFDMDLSDFLEGDEPITYEKARQYFARDPSQRFYHSPILHFPYLNVYLHVILISANIRWAAYVAGTVLVLMKELGIRFENSISLLVSPTPLLTAFVFFYSVYISIT